jgi:hypothetical protein
MFCKLHWKVISIILSCIFLHACASPKYLPKQKIQPSYMDGIANSYKTLSQAFFSRGFILGTSDLKLVQQINYSPLPAQEINGLFRKMDISEIELVLSLPNDANFHNLKAQKKLWASGHYLTKEGIKKVTQPETKHRRDSIPLIDTSKEIRLNKKIRTETEIVII